MCVNLIACFEITSVESNENLEFQLWFYIFYLMIEISCCGLILSIASIRLIEKVNFFN